MYIIHIHLKMDVLHFVTTTTTNHFSNNNNNNKTTQQNFPDTLWSWYFQPHFNYWHIFYAPPGSISNSVKPIFDTFMQHIYPLLLKKQKQMMGSFYQPINNFCIHISHHDR
eukprot:UN04762